jgi:hypothetical protein
VHHQALMGKRDRSGDTRKQLEPGRERELPLFHVTGQRHAVDVLHHQVGTELAVASVEQAHDVRVLEQREDLPLVTKARHRVGADQIRSHAPAQQLDRDLGPILAVVALGQDHDAHPALTDRPKHAVGPQALSDAHALLAVGQLLDLARDHLLQPLRRLIEGTEQRLDLGPQRGIDGAQPSAALGRRQLDDRVKQRLDLAPALRCHSSSRMCR